MARVTVRFSYAPVTGTLAEMFPTGVQLTDGFGRKAVADVQKGPWADVNFWRVTGKSRRAWRHEVDRANLGLALTNDATNKQGKRYARFVHYRGAPKTATVVKLVQAHMDRVIAPELLHALGRDFKRGLAVRRKVVAK